MNKLTIRKIVIAGVMSAIAIFLGASHLGFIPWFTGIALTIMAVPVIIGAILEGPTVGLIIGFIFGLFSLLQASIAPTGPGDVVFTNPLISVLPRLFIGPVAWVVYGSVRRWNTIAALVAGGVAGSLTNTVLVLTMFGLLGLAPWAALGTIAVTNGLPEAGAAAVISVAVVTAWQRIEHGRRGSRLE